MAFLPGFRTGDERIAGSAQAGEGGAARFPFPVQAGAVIGTADLVGAVPAAGTVEFPVALARQGIPDG